MEDVISIIFAVAFGLILLFAVVMEGQEKQQKEQEERQREEHNRKYPNTAIYLDHADNSQNKDIWVAKQEMIIVEGRPKKIVAKIKEQTTGLITITEVLNNKEGTIKRKISVADIVDLRESAVKLVSNKEGYE
ncbi:hypothetical protein [Lactobacillus sp. ESL0681]|uniref:hypothetical protein n=1 Tax=Lactobacillus sp. ESL0681 TaxID=2983211 RepID=UPI0023F66A5E|nr:hypothetical protein [Lactobacillus sp. ESL0681]WEV41313.1 hypothetical protein OZX59_09290 [Lactobacillus sp. ESL0681]